MRRRTRALTERLPGELRNAVAFCHARSLLQQEASFEQAVLTLGKSTASQEHVQAAIRRANKALAQLQSAFEV
jgi:hypothetical protein